MRGAGVEMGRGHGGLVGICQQEHSEARWCGQGAASECLSFVSGAVQGGVGQSLLMF